MWVVRVDCRFGGLDREVVHHLHRGGQHSGGDDVAYGCACLIRGRKCGEQSLHAFGALHDTQDNFCRDAERALRADENSRQIVARSVECFAAEMHAAVPSGSTTSRPKHMSRRESVLQAVRAAGIFRDISANAAN